MVLRFEVTLEETWVSTLKLRHPLRIQRCFCWVRTFFPLFLGLMCIVFDLPKDVKGLLLFLFHADK